MAMRRFPFSKDFARWKEYRCNGRIQSQPFTFLVLIYSRARDVSLDPNRLRISTIGRDIPYFESGPGSAAKVDGDIEFAMTKRARVAQFNALAKNVDAIAGDDFREAQRKGPIDRSSQV